VRRLQWSIPRHSNNNCLQLPFNGLTLLVVLAFAVGIVVAWRAGLMKGRRDSNGAARDGLRPAVVNVPAAPVPVAEALPAPDVDASDSRIIDEQARLMRSLEDENASLRAKLAHCASSAELAAAHAETARYRELVIDIENNAPPPLLDGPNAPDDLKLIVGIGPVLERMLHKMGVTTYRQIARWSEREIDEVDAQLPEFPGRIRRDAWTTQARELHQSKFGETLPARER
jgi:predicted flap endonuclease-1-like 5' DNA nuclease